MQTDLKIEDQESCELELWIKKWYTKWKVTDFEKMLTYEL